MDGYRSDRRGETPTKTLAHQAARPIGAPRACSIMARSPHDSAERPDIRLQSDPAATLFRLGKQLAGGVHIGFSRSTAEACPVGGKRAGFRQEEHRLTARASRCLRIATQMDPTSSTPGTPAPAPAGATGAEGR